DVSEPGAWAASGRAMLLLSSVAGQMGSQTDPPYSAAKAAVINFAQCAAKDLAPHGVRVNALCPGMVKTPLNRSVYEAWAREQPEPGQPSYEEWTAEKIQKLVPLNRWQEPEDIAAMAVFLASSRGRNITGQTINVDGGDVMHWLRTDNASRSFFRQRIAPLRSAWTDSASRSPEAEGNACRGPWALMLFRSPEPTAAANR